MKRQKKKMEKGALKSPTDRSFGLTFAGVFALLGGGAFWKQNPWWWTFLIESALLLLVALTVPRLLYPLNRAWMWLGAQLNRIVSPIVMGAMFFLVLTPVAMILRLRGRDALRRRFESGLSTYWLERDPPGPDISNFPRQF